MKRYLIETSVDNAEGSQCWYVDASSESEALEKYREGGCDLYSSDVDVTSLGEPEISGETTLDDFGDFAEKPAQQQEPVAWILKCGEQQELWWEKPPFGEAVPLYTSPPAQRKPLTDELEALFTNIDHAISSGAWNVQKGSQTWEIIEEAKTTHGIKEQP